MTHPKVSPYPTPRIGGAMLRPGVGEMYDDACYLWYALMLDVHERPRLRLRPLHQQRTYPFVLRRARGWAPHAREDDDWEDDDLPWHHDAEGERPAWLDDDLDGGDLEYELGLLFSDAMAWGLRRGILPGQPFAVYVGRPEWSVSWDESEADMSVDCQVVRVLPPEMSLRQLEAMIVEMRAAERHTQDLREDEMRARWNDTASMSLRVDHFPTGYHVTLDSRVAGEIPRRELASVRVEAARGARGATWAPRDVAAAVGRLRTMMAKSNPGGLQWLDAELARARVPGLDEALAAAG